MIGAGPICDRARAGARRGSACRVTVLQRGPRRAARARSPSSPRGSLARLRAEGVELARRRRRRPRHASARDGTKTVHAGERSWTAAEIFVGAGRTPNVEGLGLEERRREGRRRGRRGRRQAAHERQVDLRRGRRRRAPSVHALRRLRGRARGAQHVPAGLQRRRVPRAVVHVHRSRARARRADRGAGARAARRRRRARLAPGPVALRPRPRGLRRRRRAADRHREGPRSSARTRWRRAPAS